MITANRFHFLQSPDRPDAGGGGGSSSGSGGRSGGGGGGGAAAASAALLSFRNLKRNTSPEANSRATPVIPHTMLATRSAPLTRSLLLLLLPASPPSPPYEAPRHPKSSLEPVASGSGAAGDDDEDELGMDGGAPKKDAISGDGFAPAGGGSWNCSP